MRQTIVEEFKCFKNKINIEYTIKLDLVDLSSGNSQSAHKQVLVVARNAGNLLGRDIPQKTWDPDFKTKRWKIQNANGT